LPTCCRCLNRFRTLAQKAPQAWSRRKGLWDETPGGSKGSERKSEAVQTGKCVTSNKRKKAGRKTRRHPRQAGVPQNRFGLALGHWHGRTRRDGWRSSRAANRSNPGGGRLHGSQLTPQGECGRMGNIIRPILEIAGRRQGHAPFPRLAPERATQPKSQGEAHDVSPTTGPAHALLLLLASGAWGVARGSCSATAIRSPPTTDHSPLTPKRDGHRGLPCPQAEASAGWPVAPGNPFPAWIALNWVLRVLGVPLRAVAMSLMRMIGNRGVGLYVFCRSCRKHPS
jgi:hypothetical protein